MLVRSWSSLWAQDEALWVGSGRLYSLGPPDHAHLSYSHQQLLTGERRVGQHTAGRSTPSWGPWRQAPAGGRDLGWQGERLLLVSGVCCQTSGQFWNPSLQPCRALEGRRRDGSAGGGGQGQQSMVGTVIWTQEVLGFPLGWGGITSGGGQRACPPGAYPITLPQ